MKKCLVLFISVLMLSACASLQSKEKLRVYWIGKDIENYIISNGIPISKYALSEDKTVYVFRLDCKYDSKTGETLVTVGKDNLIVNVFATVNCPSYFNSIEYQIDSLDSRINSLESKL